MKMKPEENELNLWITKNVCDSDSHDWDWINNDMINLWHRLLSRGWIINMTSFSSNNKFMATITVPGVTHSSGYQDSPGMALCLVVKSTIEWLREKGNWHCG